MEQACHSSADETSGDLHSKAQRFSALPDLVINLPDSVGNAESIPLNNLDVRLKEWRLI